MQEVAAAPLAEHAAAPRRTLRPRRRFRLPIAAVLVVGFGALMLVAVASTLALGLTSTWQNTQALLKDKANLALDNLAVRLDHQLAPVADQAAFLAARIMSGELDPADRERLAEAFRNALAATPHVTGIAFVDPDDDAVWVSQVDGNPATEFRNVAGMPQVGPAVAEARTHREPFWADPMWDEELGTSLVTLRWPLYRNDAFSGLLVVAVSLADLSRFLADFRTEAGMGGFVLYDDQHVLAHPRMADVAAGFFMMAGGPPLPRIDQVNDPVLARLWEEGGRNSDENWRDETSGLFITATGEEDGGPDYVFLLRPSVSYGSRPWTLGIAFPAGEVTMELDRFRNAAVAGVAILVASVALALLLGLPISRRIRAFAAAAGTLSALDFGAVPHQKPSRIRELDHAATTFNTMVTALRWFETYVPKSLVLRLIGTGAQGALDSEERVVTVMFTDICGFSTLAETMGAGETATLLNQHFALLAGCIEAEGGTVDKFIGDAVMAFWGAPEEQPDHAARSVRAALEIARVVGSENRRRRAAGLAPIPVRLGIHTGPAVVGNIGSPSRVNYTIVGNTVNVAARIEALASSFRGDEECIVLASAATIGAAGSGVEAGTIGRHPLRGQSGATEIFRILPGAARGPDGQP